MDSSERRRKFPRKEVQLGILFKQGVEWYPATIKNLSEGGVAFKTDMKAKSGDLCHIYFSDSEEVRTTELNAEVVRSEIIEGSLSVKYLVAVKLIDANDQYMQDVQAIFQEDSPDAG